MTNDVEHLFMGIDIFVFSLVKCLHKYLPISYLVCFPLIFQEGAQCNLKCP